MASEARAVHELEIAAGPAEVWKALVDPESTRRWYHSLSVSGDWRAGGEVTYRLPSGEPGEMGSVLDVDEGRRLVLETRYAFDEAVQKEPAHRTTWELQPISGGTHVRVTFEIPEEAPIATRWLVDEGAYELKALRLELDPAERQRIARRDAIGEVEIRDLTPELVADYQRFFDDVAFQDHPEWQSCYCAETNLPPDPLRSVAGNRAGMTEMIDKGEVTALLAFADGGPVAWCNYGETTRLAGVMAKLGLESADHEKVGSVACFVISSQYRRHGLARRLLEVACTRLKERGCTQVEAYPSKDSTSEYSNYRGPLALYLEAGFAPYRETGRSVIVRKSL